jgi:hypothetical protein
MPVRPAEEKGGAVSGSSTALSEFTIDQGGITLFKQEISKVREEVRDNPYLEEALKALGAGAYRGAIGSYWNAVIDDLRQKIEHRSLDLFNKEMKFKKTIASYDDFQNHVTDHDLIEGAHKVGVLSWEARKLLHQARETRNIFDGHPKSSAPSIFKVLNMISDCNKYVLSEEPMPEIIDIDKYLATMDSSTFSQNEVAIEQALSDLPEVYKTEMMNKFFSTYIHDSTSLDLRANIELCTPILWTYLSKDQKSQIGGRFDKEMVAGNQQKIKLGIDFLLLVKGLRYVSSATRKAIYTPAIVALEKSITDWTEETKAVKYLRSLGSTIPASLLGRYVGGLTLVYVGTKGFSSRYGRTDFYADSAVSTVRRLFEAFDDSAIAEFIEFVKTNSDLRARLVYSMKIKRLRNLGQTLLDRPNLKEDHQDFLELLVDEGRQAEFIKLLPKH